MNSVLVHMNKLYSLKKWSEKHLDESCLLLTSYTVEQGTSLSRGKIPSRENFNWTYRLRLVQNESLKKKNQEILKSSVKAGVNSSKRQVPKALGRWYEFQQYFYPLTVISHSFSLLYNKYSTTHLELSSCSNAMRIASLFSFFFLYIFIFIIIFYCQ